MESDLRAARINLMVSMIGAVTPNWRAVFLERIESVTLATFVIASDSVEDREEISEVESEFSILQTEERVSAKIIVSDAPLKSIGDLRKLIFARKEA